MNQQRVGIYCRVSTQDQKTDLQVQELTDYAKARGWAISRVYEDKLTGKNDARPAFRQLMVDAQSRNMDIVLTWKLDRLFRSLKGLLTTLEEFTELGIAFVSLKDNIDLTTASGRLMMHLLGAFAEFERSLIVERVRAGIAHAKAKGSCFGRPKTREDHKIWMLRNDGLSIRHIATRLQCSKAAVQRALYSVPKTHPKVPEKVQSIQGENREL
jgi:DNA invertase Pin-like site-specific DNA recombinase